MKTLLTRRPFFSADNKTVELFCPQSWAEMTQDQLRYAFAVLAMAEDKLEAKTYMLIRFSGIYVVRRSSAGWVCYVRTKWWRRQYFTLQTWQVQSMLRQLDYVDSYETMANRLEFIHGYKAVDMMFHGLAFIDYLNAEVLYQGYMNTHKAELIEKLACILYRDRHGNAPKRIKLDAAQLLGTTYWFSYVKMVLWRAFPNFFKPATASGRVDMLAAVNNQMRALTDGDITKEAIIKQMDCWRALTELDAKAREAAEWRAKYGKQ